MRLETLVTGCLPQEDGRRLLEEKDFWTAVWNREARSSYFHDEPPIALIGFDVDQIHSYVFATSKPLEVKGASSIVIRFTEEEVPKLVQSILGKPEEWIVFLTSGTGLLFAPASKAEAVAAELRRKFQDLTKSGSCSTAIIKLFPDELHKPATQKNQASAIPFFKADLLAKIGQGQSLQFGEWFNLMSVRMQEVKSRKPLVGFDVFPPFLKKCESCGSDLATKMDEYTDQAQILCESCHQKRVSARNINKSSSAARSQPRTFMELFEGEDGASKRMAVLYGDGNNMGAALTKLTSLESFQEFSLAVSNWIKSSLQEALAKNNATDASFSLVSGGDDILLILPASKARATLESLVEVLNETRPRFSELSLQGLIDKIGFSFGLVIAPPTYPIRFFLDYAQELLANAKKRAYEDHQKASFAIDYITIRGGSPLSRDIRSLRATHCVNRDAGLSLTGKPYTWSEYIEQVQRLIENIKSSGIKEIQVRAALKFLETQGFREARSSIRYQWSRVAEWRVLLPDSDPFPAFVFDLKSPRDQCTHWTPWFDAHELLELEG